MKEDSRSSGLRKLYRSLKRAVLDARNRGRSTQDVFEEIYAKNKWGGQKGELCSGGGSVHGSIVEQYIDAVSQKLKSKGLADGVFVDLGCGDFEVGRALAPLAGKYVAVDVVKPLIEKHRSSIDLPNVVFEHMDIVRDELPAGDVCFIRQVLQHLSNEQIGQILSKLGKYRAVFITEHLPSSRDGVVPNVDKVQGGEIRLFRGSGVYLDEAPFSLDPSKLSVVLEVPGHGFGGGISEPGVIRTTLYSPHGD